MRKSGKGNMLPEEIEPAGNQVLDQQHNTMSAVDEIVDHVTKMVAEYGNGEKFDAQEWVNQWLDRYVPALGGKPRAYLDNIEGRALVKNVLDMSWSGTYS